LNTDLLVACSDVVLLLQQQQQPQLRYFYYSKCCYSNAAQLLNGRIFDTSLHRNVTELRRMMHSPKFDEICTNFTHDERTELSERWEHDMEDIVLVVDEVRENILIPSILQVSSIRNISGWSKIRCRLSRALGILRKNVKSFPSLTAHRAVLISVS